MNSAEIHRAIGGETKEANVVSVTAATWLGSPFSLFLTGGRPTLGRGSLPQEIENTTFTCTLPYDWARRPSRDGGAKIRTMVLVRLFFCAET